MLYYIDFEGNRFIFSKDENYSFKVKRENLFEVIKEMENDNKDISFWFSSEALKEICEIKGVQVPVKYKVFIVILYIIAITLLCRLLF